MQSAINKFKAGGITVFERGSPNDDSGSSSYEKAIATSNLMFRFSRPDCVVRPRTIAHVQSIIKQAKASNLRVTIKGNGHSYAGHSTAFSGISLDLRDMKKVSLDMKSLTVTADAGCQWGRVYRTLIDGRHNGYIINGGRCPTVGVSGFVLGGGLGPFTRSFGMGCDTLMEATVVTADGEVVTVSEADPPGSDKGRLFWALCGAGGGNFGVLVRVKMKVQKLQNKFREVVAGRYVWKPQEGLTDGVIATMADFYTAKWPNNATIDSTWLCDLRDGGPVGAVRFNISFDGSKDQYDRLIDKRIKREDLRSQLKKRVLAEKSTRFLYETLASQWLEETERSYPTNKTYELFSSFIFTNEDKAIIQKVTSALQKLMEEFQEEFRGEKVNFMATWIHSGGKAAERKPTDTAFFWRQAVFHMYLTVEWMDKWMETEMRVFLAKAKGMLRPLSLNGEAAFMNFPDRDLPTRVHERMYFGDNAEELRRVKELWDKDKFFHWSQAVRLPGDPEQDDDEDDEDDEIDKADKLAGEQWDTYHSKDVLEDLQELADLGF